MADLGSRRLYLCTADREDLQEFLRACMRGGVDIVQLREKDLDARPLLQRARLAAAVCAELGVPFIVNDRPDIALACGADGVHVGQEDIPASVARAVLGDEAIVGLSTHSGPQWDASVREPVDYLSAGPVNPTPTKPGRPGTGLEYLTQVASTFAGAEGGLPWFVTGGVTPDTVPRMASAGARRFVVVRYLTESPEPEAAARRLRAAIDQHAGWSEG